MKVNNCILNNLSRFWIARCLLCGSTDRTLDLLCGPCQAEFVTQPLACQQCALPLSQKEESLEEGLVCGACQKSPPAHLSAYRFAAYEAPLDRLILQFKFQQNLAIGKKLGTLMAQDIVRRQLSLPDILLPVPLHESRLKQRGYNQALELARPIAANLKIPLDVQSCRRLKATDEQVGLSAKSRKTNLKGAFAVKGNFQDMRVAIIDDVMTTGSTVHELSQQLINAGAKQVDVWVCARAVL
jgi:ComF family protein